MKRRGRVMGADAHTPTLAKRLLVAWLAAWPTLTLVLAVSQPFSAHWPLVLKSLVSSSTMVMLMYLVSVPLMVWLLRRSL